MLEEESGYSLTARMAAQAESFGALRKADEIRSLELEGEVKTLTGASGVYPVSYTHLDVYKRQLRSEQ